jgi:ABC-2 type transport system permease protein
VNKSWILIKREFLTRVKTKGFIIGTFAAPLLMISITLLPAILMQLSPEAETLITVADLTDRLAPILKADVEESRKDVKDKTRYRITEVKAPPASLDSLKLRMNREILRGKNNVFLVLPADIFQRNQFELYAQNIGNFQLNETLSGMVTSAVSKVRLSDSGMDSELIKRLSQRVSAKTFKVAEGGVKEESGALAFVLSYILVFILYMTLIFYGTFVMRGVIEDKSSRVIEVLLSSAKPYQIMAGKVLGIGAVGLVQITVWGLCIFLLSALSALFAFMAGIPLPSVSIWTIIAFIGFFLIGYVLYASLYAALGSMGNSESEVQSLQWPAIAPLIFSLVVMMSIIKDPNGTMAVVLSMIPFFSPMLMFLRISLHAAPLYQVILCLTFCILTLGFMIWFSGRIFRIGILMYGKRPTLPEVLKWIRYS